MSFVEVTVLCNCSVPCNDIFNSTAWLRLRVIVPVFTKCLYSSIVTVRRILASFFFFFNKDNLYPKRWHFGCVVWMNCPIWRFCIFVLSTGGCFFLSGLGFGRPAGIFGVGARSFLGLVRIVVCKLRRVLSFHGIFVIVLSHCWKQKKKLLKCHSL